MSTTCGRPWSCGQGEGVKNPIFCGRHKWMAPYLSLLCCACFFQLRTLGNWSSSFGALSPTLVHAFVSSRMDYCSTIYAGLLLGVLHSLSACLVQLIAIGFVVSQYRPMTLSLATAHGPTFYFSVYLLIILNTVELILLTVISHATGQNTDSL